MRTLHVVSHTHWDREWYRPFQEFRLKLVHLIDDLLVLLARDKHFKFFMLDGQTIVLDDYLAMRPQNESILREHIRKGRILIGPWHILPDMFLVSPEAHIRNLLQGDRTARRFGPKMMIGYMPDSFGHFAQMPQLIRGFGMDVISLWRGPDDQPVEFWWEAPDDSRVLMAYLRDSYSNGASLQASIPSEFAAGLDRAAGSLAAHSAVSDYLIMLGTDHMEPWRDTSKAIAYSNAALRGTKVIHSTLPGYVKAIKNQIAKSKMDLPIYSGELRSSKNSHLLPGVLSARIWIKQRNQACETLLEKWAEPFSTFASLAGSETQMIHEPSSIIRQAWRLLMECHPHDSICGCSIDQVHAEMKPRFDQVEQIGEEITKQSLESLVASIQTRSEQEAVASMVVFNPSSFVRTDCVTMELSLPSTVYDFEIGDERGNMIPYQSASGKVSELMNVTIRREELGGLLSMIHDGRAGNLAVQDIEFKREERTLHVEAVFAENGNPKAGVWEDSMNLFQGYLKDSTIETFHVRARSPESAQIAFVATGVPGLGWKVFHIREKESKPVEIRVSPLMRMLAPLASLPITQKILERFTEPKNKPPYIIANEYFIVELDVEHGCTLKVTDKRSGEIYRGLNRFVDGGDCGDEYNFCPPSSDAQQNSPNLKSATVQRSQVQQTLTVSFSLDLPKELNPDRKSRSNQRTKILIATTITLIPGVPRIDIQTTVDNRAKDHRLRVHFPAPFSVKSADYDGHFEIRSRKIGLPQFDEKWMEQPRPEVPQQAFTDVSDGEHGLTIANRGLPEVEALQREDGNIEIALTLLRCVGWLSRDDFPNRKGHAGPFLETPAAQMQGTWTFDYSIIPHSGNWEEAFQDAYAFAIPLRGASTDLHDGALPASGSFVEVTPATFALSAIKESEDGRGWIVRGVNLSNEAMRVEIKPWKNFKKVEQINLAEQTIRPLKSAPNGRATVEARAHEIVSVLFKS